MDQAPLASSVDLPPTVEDTASSSAPSILTIHPSHSNQCSKSARSTVCIMVLINMLNYMDRFTIAGIPNDVKQFYHIKDRELGLLQTMFFVSYTCLSPIAGYLGDRWKRKRIMQLGLSFWVIVTFVSSFIPENLFTLFLFTRCLVGIGEASYSTIAPTIITDLFVCDKRIQILGLFYFAVPVGSGLGFIAGSVVTRLTSHWYWSLRITPVLGLISIVLLTFFHEDPPRGQAEGGSCMHPTSWLTDIKCLIVNRALMLVCGAFTCVCFILGALAWFSVDLIELALSAKYDDSTVWKKYNVPVIFGVGTCLAGIFGVLSGAQLGKYLNHRIPAADAYICAVSLFLGGPMLFLSLVATSWNFITCVIFVIIAQYLLCITWALVSDMTMSVVIPTRRSTASALQMIMSHVLGDCISPAIVGAIAEAARDSQSQQSQYLGLQRALFITPFICVLGAFLFLLVTHYLVKEKQAVYEAVEASQSGVLNLTSDQITPVPEPDYSIRL